MKKCKLWLSQGFLGFSFLPFFFLEKSHDVKRNANIMYFWMGHWWSWKEQLWNKWEIVREVELSVHAPFSFSFRSLLMHWLLLDFDPTRSQLNTSVRHWSIHTCSLISVVKKLASFRLNLWRWWFMLVVRASVAKWTAFKLTPPISVIIPTKVTYYQQRVACLLFGSRLQGSSIYFYVLHCIPFFQWRWYITWLTD